MAGIAMLREDWPDVTVELNVAGYARRGCRPNQDKCYPDNEVGLALSAHVLVNSIEETRRQW